MFKYVKSGKIYYINSKTLRCVYQIVKNDIVDNKSQYIKLKTPTGLPSKPFAVNNLFISFYSIPNK